MFTGIVSEMGEVLRSDAGRLEIAASFRPEIGDSIAVNGACLTVESLSGGRLQFRVSEETDQRTALGTLRPGDKVNLEQAVPADGRFGGHIVQGHVDGTSELLERKDLEGSAELWLRIPADLERYVVEKGSITLDGVSLTVMAVSGDRFAVSVIPHTLRETNLGLKQPGHILNVEVDIVAKYVERLLGAGETASRAAQDEHSSHRLKKAAGS